MSTNSPLPRIEGLDIIEMIGQGGQASIYRAHQPSHDREVAVRVIHTPVLGEVVDRRFDRERQALGRISDHPGIVSLLESGRTGHGKPYLVLEYAPGGSLAERLSRGPLTEDEASAIALCLADALDTAHGAGVLHGDIKPENVLCSSYGTWQLSDFGVAILLSGTGPVSTTVAVSFAHASPESFDSVELTAAADVYSLASTLYTMLTGDQPFAAVAGESRASTIRRIVMDPRPDAAASGVALPMALVISRAMIIDRDSRTRTAADFADQLRRARFELGLPAVTKPTEPDAGAETGTGVSIELSTDTDTIDLSKPGQAPAPPPIPPGLQQPERRRSRARRRAVRAMVAAGMLALFAVVLSLSGVAEAAFDVIEPGIAQATEFADDGGEPDGDEGSDGGVQDGDGDGVPGAGNGGPPGGDGGPDGDGGPPGGPGRGPRGRR